MRFDELPEDVLADISNEIQAGRKLAAVKLYKDATGLSLLESKTAVEGLAEQMQKNPSKTTEGKSFAQTPDLHDKILDSIFRGEKLQAVKLYRDNAGVSLREAKEFIEDLTDKLQEEAADQFESGNRGCLGLISVACVLGFLLVLVAAQA